MTLTDEQKQKVRAWAASGATLNDIQTRLRDECEVNLTYMQSRLLLIDLDVTLQEEKTDDEPPAPAEAEEEGIGGDEAYLEDETDLASEPAGPGKVQISVDELALPGAIASGKALFSDGKRISWVLDQMGRLSLHGAEPGYQPPAADLPVFQRELQVALRKRGY